MLDPRNTTRVAKNGRRFYTDVSSVKTSLGRVSLTYKKRLLRATAKVLLQEDSPIDEDDIRDHAILLIAGIPDSWKFIERVLQSENYEAHFSFFCFFNEVEEVDYRHRLLFLVEGYLTQVRHELACAAWMAGDLLGDHWAERDEAVETLLRVLIKARFRAGKYGALHGIEMALRRKDFPSSLCSSVKETLKTASKSGRSMEVRRRARSLLSNLK